jgi:CHASE2 domain-containing sensor protein
MRRTQWLRTAMKFSATLMAISAAAIAVDVRSKEPMGSPRGGPDGSIFTLRTALDGRPELAKVLQSMQTAIGSGTQLSQREQYILVTVVASRNRCLY